MRETGTVQVDHHQFLLTTSDAATTDVTAEGTLIWAGPGFVSVLTGIANGPAVLTLTDESDDDGDLGNWEVVEETVIETISPLHVTGLDGAQPSEFSAIKPGRYLLRAHARGRAAHYDLGVAEPTETYLLRLTPTITPHAAITCLRASPAHTDISTAPKQRPQLDATVIYLLGEDGTYMKVDRFGPEAYAFYERRDGFGGRPPTGPALLNLSVKNSASKIAYLDRDLVDEVLAMSQSEQTRLVRWCARQAFERCGLTAIADFRDALDAADAGTTPPADFVNFSLLSRRLETDPQIPLTVIPGFEGVGDLIPEYSAIGIYNYVGNPAIEPWQTLAALYSALCAFGRDYPDLVRSLRAEFGNRA